MRNYGIKITAVLTALLVLTSCAEAKWWIFGKSSEEVGANYLYINGVSFEEKETKITFYKDTLPNGMLVIRGKGTAKGSKVGSVQVSIDGKEKWEKVKLNSNGVFEYSFKPDLDTPYHIYVKIIDTTDKSNDVEATHKEVIVSDRNISELIKKVLDAMVQAYKDEDARKFMSYISEDFAGDDAVLDRAIRKDFSALDNIDLRYLISGIASGQDRVYVSLQYNRMVISSKDGKPYTDKGITEFVFKLEGDSAKVFSMKQPLIFGLSDAENVATGTTNVGTNTQVINISDNGTVSVGPIGSGGAGALAVTIDSLGGIKHHQVTFTFDYGGADVSTYELQIEEAISPAGPWSNEYTGSAVVNLNLTTTNIASYWGLLYYRARLVDGSNFGPWSNIAVWDND